MNAPICIALVEDDHDLRQSTEEFLTHLGYRVWGVDSAEAFFRRFAVERADLILLDIGLPGEDGLSVAALLKANPDVAIIILSARDALDDRLKGLRTGADRYLVKPVNLSELAANIDAVAARLRRSQTHAPIELPRQTSSVGERHWQLAAQNWLLESPAGARMELTTREFVLLHKLVAVQGQMVARRELTDELFGPRVLNGAERLSVLLARLRKKSTEVLGETLPIKTAHQIGYAFTAPALLVQQLAPG